MLGSEHFPALLALVCIAFLADFQYQARTLNQPESSGELRQWKTELQSMSDLFRRRPNNECNMTAAPFTASSPCHNLPYCNTRQELLDSFAAGHRYAGRDTAFCPTTCRYRWLTQPEICSTLAKYDNIVLVGDSLIRNLHQAIVMLVREDLLYGSMKSWEFGNATDMRESCGCERSFTNDKCREKVLNHPEEQLVEHTMPLHCPSPVNIHLKYVLSYSWVIWNEWKPNTYLPTNGKKTALLAGTGIWESFDVHNTTLVAREMLSHLIRQVRGQELSSKEVIPDEQLNTTAIGSSYDMLWILPPAAGINKPAEWVGRQGNPVILNFSEQMLRNLEPIGLPSFRRWNHTSEATSWDGTHYGMATNLEEAMVLLNWLNLDQ